MDRREFLKTCGKAGIAVTAGGMLSASFLQKALADEEGGPKIIRLRGSPREMGRQYAEQAGDLIRERLKLFRAKGSKVSKENIELSKVFLGIAADSLLVEVSAMAEKLEENEDEVLTLSAEPPGAGIRQGGCTSFILDKTLSTDGQVWMGQNVDDAAELEKFGVVIIRHPLDAPPMITWALAGGIGAIGMNLEGQGLLMNYVQTMQKKPPNAIYPEFTAHSALRQGSFKDATAVLTQTQVMTPVTYLVADKDNTRVVVERTHLAFNAYTSDKHWVSYTNHFKDERMAADETTDKVFPDSKPRLKRLDSLLAKKVKSKDSNADFLKQVLSDTEEKPNGICRHAAPPTIASIIMCPARGVMFATRGGPDREKYHEFALTRKP